MADDGLLKDGNDLYYAGDFPGAEKAYRRSVELNPKNKGILQASLNNLGVVLSDLEKYDEAETVLRKALEMDPKFGMIWYNLGNVLHDLKRFDEAEEAHRRAKELGHGRVPRMPFIPRIPFVPRFG